MNLNKQGKALWLNVTNIFNTLVAVNTPEETLQQAMQQWITDFQSQVPGARVKILKGEIPRLDLIDCSRDNAKTSRDANKYLNLRARLLNTRVTAVVASRDSETSNVIIAEALRELASLVERLPFELSSRESADLFEELGIAHGEEDESDAEEASGEAEDAAGAADPVEAAEQATDQPASDSTVEEGGVIVLVPAPADQE